MSDDDKCYAATPAATLEEHILNSNIAKSETEWWAHHEITRLRAENERLWEALRPFAAITLWTDKYPDGPLSVDDNQRYVNPQWIVRARAALEGVTETPNVP